MLGTLVLCAVLVGLASPVEPSEGPFPGYSLTALLIACASIMARREPRQPIEDIRPILRRSILGIALAGLLGPLGLVIGVLEGSQITGLLYTLSGAFLSLRPPPEVVAREGRPDRLVP